MKDLLSYKSIIRLFIAGAILLASLGFASTVDAQSSCGATYVVQRGDYLTKIARNCGVTYGDLLRANPGIVNPSRIYPGQVLNIPSGTIPVTGRIQFAPGNTSAFVEGSLAANSSQSYSFGAAANQILEVTVTSQPGLTLSIVGADGTVLTNTSGSGYRGVLPKTQDYHLKLISGSSAVDYGMVVAIPVRIQFASGGTSASVSGTVPANLSQFYNLRASQGQTLNVNVTPANSVQLIIYGMDGTVLRSGMGEGSSYSGVLPSTQDYILVLRSANVVQPYTMNVSIPAGGGTIPDTGSKSYTVKQGDTLYSIARAYGTSVTVLRRANPEIPNTNLITVGQVIYLPGATITLSNGQKVYVTAPGDYMSSIARKFGITLTALLNANTQISNPNIIYTGQRINIP